MFQTEIPPEGGFVSWIGQQVAAPIPFIVWALAMTPLEARIGPWAMRRNLLDIILYLPMGWMLSFLLGVIVYKIFPDAEVMGTRIWFVPVFLLALAFCIEGSEFSFGQAFREIFYPEFLDISGLGFVLMTCPTVSAIAYSLGMAFAARKARTRQRP